MRSFVDSLAVAVILLASVAVAVGFYFLLWIVITRAPDSLDTETVSVALGICLILLFGFAGED